MRILYLAFFVVMSTVSLDARAQRGAIDVADQYTLRTYEVGDLILSINDRPYSESLHPSVGNYSSGSGRINVTGQTISTGVYFAQRSAFGGGGGFGGYDGGMSGGGNGRGVGLANPANDATVTMDSLIEAIWTAVAPGSWAQNGGGEGQITRVGAALVVWQSPPVHQQIATLLDSLREGSGKRRTLRIDARWLLLNSDDLDQLVSGEDGRIESEALERFTRRPASIRGITNCFSGQLVYLVSGTRRNVVRSYIPVVGSMDDARSRGRQVAERSGPFVTLVAQRNSPYQGRSVGYQPLISTPNFGALLEIRPTLVQGDDRVTVDLKSTVTVPGEQGDQLANDADFDALAPAVDRIAIETQEFATTLRIPLGEPFLVGGMTYAPTAGDAQRTNEQEGAGEKAQLYLILELR